MVSENMLSVAADIYYSLNVDRCTCQRMEGPGAARAKIFEAVWEVGVKASYDKIGASAPSLRRDEITVQVKSSITAIRRAQEHRAGIGKQR